MMTGLHPIVMEIGVAIATALAGYVSWVRTLHIMAQLVYHDQIIVPEARSALIIVYAAQNDASRLVFVRTNIDVYGCVLGATRARTR